MPPPVTESWKMRKQKKGSFCPFLLLGIPYHLVSREALFGDSIVAQYVEPLIVKRHLRRVASSPGCSASSATARSHGWEGSSS